MITPMASAVSATKYPSFSALSTCANFCPQNYTSRFSKWFPQLGIGPFSPWNGLRHLGVSISQRPARKGGVAGKKGQCKGKVVYASLFGVGAPEALVIGVVALLVFGPKGLAEVARNLGKTLRAFQPTIKELQDVSREFKSTLEREIGLDEIQSSTQDTNRSNTTSTISTPSSVLSPDNSQTAVDPNGAASPNRAYSTEDYLKITEEQLKASAAQLQTGTSSQGESQFVPQTQPQEAVQESPAAASSVDKPGSET
ncbi:sec-independent protein translocase protein TATB, chloroplastic isoform X3 [Diospyros lotus]|uniref:sec-independent protein translocase protein TATB, chloroplastic isoform X3 n=1 Tax=Diospyros lotus TaxID=55363 RepID=UPI002256A6B9|nr:sec-independent protein translocase protein TATB, chloroplastic isoform X3 [Diospyros lotus]